MKLDRIVLAVDFSASSIAAAEWAIGYLAPGADYVLLHVLALPQPPEFLKEVLPELDSARRGIRAAAEERLQELASSLGTGRIATELAVGSPAEEIGRVARRARADVVVLGPHGQGYLAGDPLGGTAERVVRCSPVPALVARERPGGSVERVLAAVDGSHMTDCVLRWARLLRWRFSATLGVLHVLNSGLYGAASLANSPGELDVLDRRAEGATRRWLDGRLEALGIEAGDVEVLITSGEAKHEIVDAAAAYGADVVVVGSRSAADIGPAQLGAVAGSVLRGADASVLVVTDPGRDDLES